MKRIIISKSQKKIHNNRSLKIVFFFYLDESFTVLVFVVEFCGTVPVGGDVNN
jgi:hypothetical protein